MSKVIRPSVLRTSLLGVLILAFASAARACDGAAGQTLSGIHDFVPGCEYSVPAWRLQR